MNTKEYKLPSGNSLGVVMAPFEDGQELFEIVMDKAKELKMGGDREVDYQFYKDIASAAFSSKELRNSILKCSTRCMVNGERFTMNHFEKDTNRVDYVPVLTYVLMVNLEPFSRGLFATLKSEYLAELYGKLLK